ncbi:hypothetical protein CDAR_455311 [Caerostris darwini]|uniref:Uncharacterized protein n=1 Tax=Caerostris darwini TaxID=1538125 RepID=A0AAV4Q5Z1_9ARAC|nr:hypothetical protein CDAR_455311 [Caerostris darwini]
MFYWLVKQELERATKLQRATSLHVPSPSPVTNNTNRRENSSTVKGNNASSAIVIFDHQSVTSLTGHIITLHCRSFTLGYPHALEESHLHPLSAPEAIIITALLYHLDGKQVLLACKTRFQAPILFSCSSSLFCARGLAKCFNVPHNCNEPLNHNLTTSLHVPSSRPVTNNPTGRENSSPVKGSNASSAIVIFDHQSVTPRTGHIITLQYSSFTLGYPHALEESHLHPLSAPEAIIITALLYHLDGKHVLLACKTRFAAPILFSCSSSLFCACGVAKCFNVPHVMMNSNEPLNRNLTTVPSPKPVTNNPNRRENSSPVKENDASSGINCNEPLNRNLTISLHVPSPRPVTNNPNSGEISFPVKGNNASSAIVIFDHQSVTSRTGHIITLQYSSFTLGYPHALEESHLHPLSAPEAIIITALLYHLDGKHVLLACKTRFAAPILFSCSSSLFCACGLAKCFNVPHGMIVIESASHRH